MTPYRYISGIPPLRVPWSPDDVHDPGSRPGVASSRCGRMSRRHDRSHAAPNTVTRPGGTLTPRKIARSYRIDSHALDRSVRQGHLIRSAATSGAAALGGCRHSINRLAGRIPCLARPSARKPCGIKDRGKAASDRRSRPRRATRHRAAARLRPRLTAGSARAPPSAA